MRRLFVLTLAALAAAGLLWSPSAPAGESPSLLVTKVVDGPGPTGGFVVEVDCTGDGLTVLSFDAAAPGSPETQSLNVASGSGQTCTVSEVEANGAASTAYACIDSGEEVLCNGDQQVDVGVETISGTAEVIVTNTYPPSVEPEIPPIDTDDGVVEATPTYTG